VAVKVAVVAPAATKAEAGTVRTDVALLDNVTPAPPTGAAVDSVTVHVVVPDAGRVVLAHCSDVTVTGARSESVAVAVVPFSDAVTVAG
jgi:hypothetical protein